VVLKFGFKFGINYLKMEKRVISRSMCINFTVLKKSDIKEKRIRYKKIAIISNKPNNIKSDKDNTLLDITCTTK
jgi:hypothetical protein